MAPSAEFDFTADDRFAMGGQRLIAISGTEYRAEIESFTKVVAEGMSGARPRSFTSYIDGGMFLSKQSCLPGLPVW